MQQLRFCLTPRHSTQSNLTLTTCSCIHTTTPISTISDMGSPTQSNGSSNGGLRKVSCETKIYTKSTASVRPQELWWNGKDTYYNKPTLDFNHMLIYNLYDILSFEYQPSGLKVYNIIMLTQNINMPFGVARTSVLLGLQGILAWVNSGIMTFNVHSDQV